MHKSVILPNDISEALTQQCASFGRSVSENAMAVKIIRDALALPDRVKRSAPRAHIGLEDLRGAKKASSLAMDPPLIEAIKNHQRTYTIPTLSDAARDLLRLGLHLPPPPAMPRSARHYRTNLERRQQLKQMLRQGLNNTQIAVAMGVSRQRVHFMRQQESNRAWMA